MKIVLDTNVIVSSLINPDGNPAQILKLMFYDKISIMYDNRIYCEYYNILKRKKFSFPDELILALLDYIKHEGIYIIAEPINITFNDEYDKKFYEVLKSGNGEYLITGNLKHFPKDKSIITPFEFMNIFHNHM